MRSAEYWAANYLIDNPCECARPPCSHPEELAERFRSAQAEAIDQARRDNEPTLRDRFAMAALSGAMPTFFEGSSWDDYDDMAGTCYQVADAMLRAREGK